MSTGKTETYGLNQWQREDLFLMEEFNADNAAIDAALEQCALVRLKTLILTANTEKAVLDLTDLALEKFGELHFRIDGCHNSEGLKTLHMTLNGVSEEGSYLWADLAQGGALTSAASLPVGQLTNSAGGCQCGLRVELALYERGISCRCAGIAEYTDELSACHLYLGTLGMQNYLTRELLTSVEFFFDGSAAKLLSGGSITVYGVRK